MTKIKVSINQEKESIRFIKHISSIKNIDHNEENIYKKTHKLLYSLSLITKKLNKENKNIANNKTAYINEIISDSLTYISIVLDGYSSPASLLHRRITENFFSHIFYTDHPIEFLELNEGKNKYTPINDLRIYADKYPSDFIRKDENIKYYVDNIFKNYEDLCRIAHSKGMEMMNFKKFITEIKTSDSTYDLVNYLSTTLEGVIYYFYKFHQSLKYTPIEKEAVRQSIPLSRRKNFE